ncbi:MAG: ATP-binding protein [Rhodoglobus sp.]|nr:ATP-binding protein [Rhodoglobus sp.]
MTATVISSGPQAALRVARTITAVVGVATFVFFALGLSAIVASMDHVDPVYNIAAAAILFGIPPVLAVVGLFVGLPTLRRLLGTYAVLFLLVVVAWAPAMQHALPVGLSPWPLEVTALGTVPAAIAWRPAVAWVYLVVNSLLIAPVRFIAAGLGDPSVPLQYAFFTLTFAAIFTALAMVAMRNGYALDAAIGMARETTSRAAAAASRAREQSRLDALVHDNVMGTLFYAARGGLNDSVRRQAIKTLAQLEELREGRHELDGPVDSNSFVARIRSEIFEASADIDFAVIGERSAPIPHDVAAAFAEAASEAVRNSLTHAGTAAQTMLNARVELSEDRVCVVIKDAGRGFDPRDVPPHRLGIVVSIRGRLSAVPGGSGAVATHRGTGTVVTLTWVAS